MKKWTTTKVVMLATSMLVISASGQDAARNLTSSNSESEYSEGYSPWWGGWKTRVFTPSLRVYFDLGTDDVGEIDIYNDGNIVPTINLLEFYQPHEIRGFMKNSERKFTFGPTFGLGVTAPADDSEDGSQEADDSPVLLLTAGFLAEISATDNTSVGIETGFAWGISADEGLDDISDSAFYVGLALSIEW